MGARVRVGTVCGPLTSFAPGFELWLAARGFSSSAVSHRRWLFDHLNRWLVLEGLGADELTAERAEQFLGARRAAGYATWVSPRSVALALEYLREIRAVPPVVAVVAEGPLEELLEGYRSYLVLERGLAGSTIAEYERVARLFFGQRPGELALQELVAADVSGFLARECPRRSVSGARHLVSPLRSLLRYLHVAGLIRAPLVWAVPGVADLRDRSLPRAVEPEVVARLLASCDRRRTVGRRDYAILLLLIRLGLRVGEVAAIELDDVDWRRGEIVIRGKGNRQDRLPLPVDVGEALVAYLRRRGPDECRALFLKVHAPAGALVGNTVCGVVADACVRAGMPRVGAHRLRHSAATAMLRRGASLAEIAQVLRHREIKTTAIYAKVDRGRLRALAQPWPGGRS
jgi:integrase/recombinase XerD